jgi:hypothetical protein
LTNPLVYNIPARHIESYRGRNVIIRSSTTNDIVDCLGRADPSAVRFIQLLDTPSDTSDLEACGESLPIEIVLRDPVAEFSQLYNYTNLIDTHPVRVAMPVLPGFSKAAKLAVSLDFAVKLEMDQPDSLLLEELTGLLDFYLHRTSVRQPIEFFQSVLLSFYRSEPVSLWEIAEEDPSLVRYITGDGEETISKRFAGANLAGDLKDFVDRFGQELLTEKRECHACEFFNRCGGYFKWPDKSYDCAGIRKLFSTLSSAAAEVKHDLAAYTATEVA